MRRRVRNAFDRFQLAGAVASASEPPPPPDTGWVVYDIDGEEGYALSDADERITYDGPVT